MESMLDDFYAKSSVASIVKARSGQQLTEDKVKKLIEEEDPKKPLTDDQIASLLQSQGISVTRRTVAKYREDMNIPSTHQRRKRD